MESKKGENADMKESKGNISKKKINIKDIISIASILVPTDHFEITVGYLEV